MYSGVCMKGSYEMFTWKKLAVFKHELEITFCDHFTCKNFIGHGFAYSFRHKGDYFFILETEILNAVF